MKKITFILSLFTLTLIGCEEDAPLEPNNNQTPNEQENEQEEEAYAEIYIDVNTTSQYEDLVENCFQSNTYTVSYSCFGPENYSKTKQISANGVLYLSDGVEFTNIVVSGDYTIDLYINNQYIATKVVSVSQYKIDNEDIVEKNFFLSTVEDPSPC